VGHVVKTYRPAPKLLSEIDELLGAKYAPGVQPLQRALMLLLEGRNYARLELEMDFRDSQEGRVPPEGRGRSEYRVPVRIGAHVYGHLRAFGEGERAFSGEDRVLLKEVAERLAKFLATKGKYVLFRARQLAAVPAETSTLQAAAGDTARK
jgi:hypothetical protein